jgi:hypothetical protein
MARSESRRVQGGGRRRLVRGVGLLGSLVLLAALGEVSVRLCPSEVLPEEVQQWFADDLGMYDPALGTLVQPYHTGVFIGTEFRAPYHTDGHGFRNTQPWPDAAEIVVVGDAVAFGYGVEDEQGWPALLARAYGTQVLVVIQPSKEMTYLLPPDEAMPDPSRALRQALAQRGIASLDLTSVFRQSASTGEPLFFTANRYPNAQGQGLIAQEVVRHLTAAAQAYGLTP